MCSENLTVVCPELVKLQNLAVQEAILKHISLACFLGKQNTDETISNWTEWRTIQGLIASVVLITVLRVRKTANGSCFFLITVIIFKSLH